MEQQAYTIDEFAQVHRLCRSTVYNLIKAGIGPAIIKAGARTLISVEAAAEWRRKMEAASTEQVAA